MSRSCHKPTTPTRIASLTPNTGEDASPPSHPSRKLGTDLFCPHRRRRGTRSCFPSPSLQQNGSSVLLPRFQERSRVPRAGWGWARRRRGAGALRARRAPEPRCPIWWPRQEERGGGKEQQIPGSERGQSLVAACFNTSPPDWFIWGQRGLRLPSAGLDGAWEDWWN